MLLSSANLLLIDYFTEFSPEMHIRPITVQDFLDRGAIAEPATGKFAHQKCVTCIETDRPCVGNAIRNGRCICCEDARRVCRWIDPTAAPDSIVVTPRTRRQLQPADGGSAVSTERNSAGDEENAATTEDLQDDNGDADMGSAESDGRSKTQDNRSNPTLREYRLQCPSCPWPSTSSHRHLPTSASEHVHLTCAEACPRVPTRGLQEQEAC